MKAIMLTIRLKWFYLTYKGIKTIEVRKSAPKDFVGDVFEVVSKTNFEKDLMEIPENEREFFKQFKGKVGLKFTLNKVEEISYSNGIYMVWNYTTHRACITEKEMVNYLNHKKGYAWHISNLVIFDKPRELGEFHKSGWKEWCAEHPPILSLFQPKKCYEELKQFEITKAPQSYQFIEVKE